MPAPSPLTGVQSVVTNGSAKTRPANMK
jgi:hypothetical protein